MKVGDIVTSIHFPVPPEGLKGRYIKLGRNKASDLAIVGVTASGYPDVTRPSGFCMKLALASVAPTPLVADQVEEILNQYEGSLLQLASLMRIWPFPGPR